LSNGSDSYLPVGGERSCPSRAVRRNSDLPAGEAPFRPGHPGTRIAALISILGILALVAMLLRQ
jgi:hypothetical protein